MSKPMGKTLYMVAVTRGRRTVYKYGDRLKDAVALLGLKSGEKFAYVRYEHGGRQAGVWHGASWSTA